MARMIVTHRVADFNNWKKAFDSMAETRKAHGWIGHEVLRDEADPNKVTIINKMKSLDAARAYGTSPDIKAAMANGGVLSAPEITFLNDEEVVSY
ncbi:MAG: antibiotic biosynthesis monooxygenase [Bacteroidetes bacterium]|nr:antibiotic biosynthesis monooxygenase [Bacteroidota bacterium]